MGNFWTGLVGAVMSPLVFRLRLRTLVRSILPMSPRWAHLPTNQKPRTSSRLPTRKPTSVVRDSRGGAAARFFVLDIFPRSRLHPRLRPRPRHRSIQLVSTRIKFSRFKERNWPSRNCSGRVSLIPYYVYLYYLRLSTENRGILFLSAFYRYGCWFNSLRIGFQTLRDILYPTFALTR